MTPWWARVLAIFAASRVVTTTILLAYAERQPANPWTGASPGYFEFAKIWDGTWYEIIAHFGYPSELPIDESGHVRENAWAFMPLYPGLVRVVETLTGLEFAIAAVLVSVAFAAGTALMLHRLLTLVLPSGTAYFAVALFCFAPLSPILQVAYAESMHAFLLTLALYLLMTRRYWLIAPVIVVASFTRPSGLAFALALGLHFAHRWWVRRRDPFPVREQLTVATVTVVSVVAGFGWLLIAWAVTGSITAYTDTELAWRAAYIGHQHLIPFTSWFQGAEWWFRRLGFDEGSPVGGIALVIALLIFAALLFAPAVRRLGVDLRLWVVSYSLYLLAVFFPQSSTPRLLLPLFPLLGALAQPRHVVYRVALLVVFVALQVGWVHIAWWVDGRDWTPP